MVEEQRRLHCLDNTEQVRICWSSLASGLISEKSQKKFLNAKTRETLKIRGVNRLI